MEGDLHIQMIQNGPNRAKEQSPTMVERRADPSKSQVFPISLTYTIKYGLSLCTSFCPDCEDVSSLYSDISVLSFKFRVVNRIYTFKTSQKILLEKGEIFEGESYWLTF